MDEYVHILIDAVDLAKDERSIRNALRNFAAGCGFDRYAYLHPFPTCTNASSDYPPEWQEIYFRDRYANIDPVVTTAKRRNGPFVWSANRASATRHSAEERKFFAQAADFGICSGITIPLEVAFGTVAMLTLASSRHSAENISLRDTDRAATAVAFVHLRLTALADARAGESQVRLTAQETTCLTWCSLGKYMPEIAAILGIEHRTVQYHLDNAREKLGAVNLPHAVRIAMEKKLLN